MGYSLKDLGLKQHQIPKPKGFAIQARINMETIDNQGNILAKTGQLGHFDLPFGKGIRVETSGYIGYINSPNFDMLLAKLIINSKGDNFKKALKKLYRKLGECRIEGIDTNLIFLQNKNHYKYKHHLLIFAQKNHFRSIEYLDFWFQKLNSPNG